MIGSHYDSGGAKVGGSVPGGLFAVVCLVVCFFGFGAFFDDAAGGANDGGGFGFGDGGYKIGEDGKACIADRGVIPVEVGEDGEDAG